jgi:hypothetical protein
MATRGRSLSILIHADTKVGKSTFANTAPAPRLLIDAEAAHRFLPGRKVYWDPMRDGPPQYDGTWDTCVVIIREYTTLTQVVAWLVAGQHPFESVIIDSISEVQKKLQEQIAGADAMDQRKWGELLRHMEGLIRQLRDLTEHPTQPVTAVVLTAMTENRDNKWRPYVQGQLRTTLPYFIDIVGYMFVQQIPPADPSQQGTEIRRMLTRPHPQFEAGERVQGLIPQYVDGENINVEWMLNSVFGPLPALQTATGGSE